MFEKLFRERKSAMAKDRRDPSDEQIEAAAKALVEWQFPDRHGFWEKMPDTMRGKFKEAARRALKAADTVALKKRAAVVS